MVVSVAFHWLTTLDRTTGLTGILTPIEYPITTCTFQAKSTLIEQMENPNPKTWKLENYAVDTQTTTDYILPSDASLDLKLAMVSQFIIAYMGRVVSYSYSTNTFVVTVPDDTVKNISIVIRATNVEDKDTLQKRANSHFGR